MTRIQILQYFVFLITVLAAARAGYLIAVNTPELKVAKPVYPPPTPPDKKESPEIVSALDFIAAVGVIEANSEDVALATQIPGVVEEVMVKAGDTVSKNDELFRIDTRTRKAQLETAKAQLVSAEAQLKDLESQISIAKAKVDAAQAIVNAAQLQLEDLKSQAERSEKLFATKAITAEYNDSRQYAYKAAQSELKNKEAMLVEAQANLRLLQGSGEYKDAPDGPKLIAQRAMVEVARSQVAEAQSQFDQCTIRAPIDGTILQVDVRKGEFAPTGVFQNPLMVIGSLNPLHVRAEIDEADIPYFEPRNKAYISLRGQPQVRAEVEFVRVEPLVVPKKVLMSSISERIDTRVMQLIYKLDPAKLKSYPGQQVDMFIEQHKSQEKEKPTPKSDPAP